MDDYKRRKKRQCWLTTVAIIIFIIILFSILGATVFKAKRPITTVNTVTLHDFDASFDALSVKFHLNVSLDVSITVKNPNKVGLKYKDSSAFVEYKGEIVGQAPIPAGQISGGQTLPVNLTLTVMADRLMDNSRSLVSDLIAGDLPLSTRARISGKVQVLFVKIHVVSDSTCSVNISVSSRSVSNSDCKYNTRLS